MEIIHLVGTIIYFTMLVALSCYGLHRYVMIFLYYKYGKQTPRPAGCMAVLPKVTVQLPLYNEMYVAERLLDAVVALDYPRKQAGSAGTGRFHRRDDRDRRPQGRQSFASGASTSDHIHRTNRHGFKAGALENGLQTRHGRIHRDLRRRLCAATGFAAKNDPLLYRSERSA